MAVPDRGLCRDLEGVWNWTSRSRPCDAAIGTEQFCGEGLRVLTTGSFFFHPARFASSGIEHGSSFTDVGARGVHMD